MLQKPSNGSGLTLLNPAANSIFVIMWLRLHFFLIFALPTVGNAASPNAHSVSELPISIDKIQERASESFHGIPELTKRITDLYLAVLEKDWKKTYHFRFDEFHTFIDSDVYVASLERDAQGWQLLDIEFILVETFGKSLASPDRCRVIIRSVENPGKITRHAVVWWRQEDKDWKCDAIGVGLSPLMRSRGYDFD